MISTPRNENSLSPSVVLADGLDNPVLRLKNLRYRGRLAVAHFQHDFSTRLQKGYGFCGYSTIKLQPVRPSVQR
jgi:hypothetical protein